MSNNFEECIRCGLPAAIVAEGIFRFSGDTVQILAAPEWTKELFQQAALLAEQAAKGELTPEETVEQAERISPKAKQLFSTVFDYINKNKWNISATFFAMATFLNTCQSTPHEKRMEELMERLIEQNQHEHSSPVQRPNHPVTRAKSANVKQAANAHTGKGPNRKARRRANALSRKSS